MAKTPHFFKAKSRLGAIYKLIRQDHFISGVEDAPDHILTSGFLKKFPDNQVSQYEFSSPDQITKKDYYLILAKELKEFADLIDRQIKPHETQVIIGGDNTVTFSSMLALLKRVDADEIGYIQFDSHGEMHLYQSSISKNFHGMYMRPFFDKFDIKEIEALVPKKLNQNQIMAIGDIIYDEGDNHPGGEVEFYKQNRNIKRAEYLKNQKQILEEFETFTKKYQHLFINFDIDIFDSSVAGATGEDEGVWLKDEVFNFLDIISKHPNISIDIVEVNPHMKTAKRTIKIAQEILMKVLG